MWEFVQQYTNVRDYERPSTEAYRRLYEIKEELRDFAWRPEHHMIGPTYVQLLNDTFAASAAAGKPWQIWNANAVLGTNIRQDPKVIAASLEHLYQRVLARSWNAINYPNSAEARRNRAMGEAEIYKNPTVFDGHALERSQILDIAKDVANNMITLSGGPHRSWGFQLNQDGELRGTPVSINLVCSGVGNGGEEILSDPFFEGWVGALLGTQSLMRAQNQARINQIPNVKYAQLYYRGFIAAQATRTKHISEYIFIPESVSDMTFEEARADNDHGPTGRFFCDASFETRAADKGSFDRREECGAVQFDTERHPALSIPVPMLNLPPLPQQDVLEDCGFKGCILQWGDY